MDSKPKKDITSSLHDPEEGTKEVPAATHPGAVSEGPNDVGKTLRESRKMNSGSRNSRGRVERETAEGWEDTVRQRRLEEKLRRHGDTSPLRSQKERVSYARNSASMGQEFDDSVRQRRLEEKFKRSSKSNDTASPSRAKKETLNGSLTSAPTIQNPIPSTAPSRGDKETLKGSIHAAPAIQKPIDSIEKVGMGAKEDKIVEEAPSIVRETSLLDNNGDINLLVAEKVEDADDVEALVEKRLEEMTVAVARADVKNDDEEDEESIIRNNRKVCLIMALVVLCLALGIAFAVNAFKKDDPIDAATAPPSTTERTAFPTSKPTAVPTPTPTNRTITFGVGLNYPPFSFESEDGEIAGFFRDFADGMSAVCDNLEIVLVETAWAQCWAEGDGFEGLGSAVTSSNLDGCTGYDHRHGVRDVISEMSDAILQVDPAGLLTLLDKDGHPKVTGRDDLSGKKIIDVNGWSPIPDHLNFVTNLCTDERYSFDYELVDTQGYGHDEAMKMMRDGGGDAIFMNADYVPDLLSACGKNESSSNCTLWEGFGIEYAYVQSGQFDYLLNGTTLAMSPKGSGIRETLRPCMSEFMASKEYYDICVKYELESDCFTNEFFPSTDVPISNAPTNEQTGGCSNGYCSCNAGL